MDLRARTIFIALIFSTAIPTARGVSFWDIALPVGGSVLAVAGAPIALGAIGFTSTGIAASSLAASWMSASAIASGGGVAAGSGVAILQSISMGGLGAAASTGVAAVGATLGQAINSAIRR